MKGLKFGCVLTVQLQPQLVRKYTVRFDFPTKKAAKEAVSILAIKEGIVDLLGQIKEEPSPTFALLHTSHQNHSSSSQPAIQRVVATPSGFAIVRDDIVHAELQDGTSVGPYTTEVNSKQIAVSVAQPSHHEVITLPPPPYPVNEVRASSLGDALDGISQNLQPAMSMAEAPQDTLISPQRNTRGVCTFPDRSLQINHNRSHASPAATPFDRDQQHVLDASQGMADQPLVRCISHHAIRCMHEKAAQHLYYDIQTVGAKYGGSLNLTLIDKTNHIYTVPFDYSSEKTAEEACASKAIADGLLGLIDKTWGWQAPCYISGDGQGHPEGLGVLNKLSQRTETASYDAFSQPVSYLHQMCQVLLGSNSSDQPKYEFLRKEQGCGCFRT